MLDISGDSSLQRNFIITGFYSPRIQGEASFSCAHGQIVGDDEPRKKNRFAGHCCLPAEGHISSGSS